MTVITPPFQNLERLAFKLSPAPQLVTSNRVIIDCNDAFLNLFGYTHATLVNQLTLLIYPSQADYHAIGKRSHEWLLDSDSGFYSDERFMQHRNGEVFWARSHGYTLTPRDPFKLMIWHFERLDRTHQGTGDLTPREREIAMHIVNGLKSKEIALRLGISHRTVEVHRARLMRKLQAKTVVELVSKIIMVA
ncbi:MULTISPECIES: PAS and helix-turn-helix domain-containing protein [unclassified Pseudomonas]|jgi:PAS domain S-box-containing protein|uniref:PAS and helix-turn-helix domain-containing protein n=1 Tax=unclassified Pseudomonas TaxID=196821 RepID=UPI000F57B09B|nr:MULTISPECIES: PAS and helix-turn-helix domain-containing protein [unclassified Pseudomonas]AZF21153.1 PAS domain containing response regulator, LuxR family [Pseudomonas sp. R3-52-08]AZF26496.1 PAS domain containing response regulator, LuxR family [Pseudomonas sp. R2-60-08W]AZF31847.1 PAS domain containing response regulator, LuxR family [Pseudomonas sp. R4-35-07]AZF37125.1 PAS domain containing response regulator, LuxR family [Pseudomonas sp. R4-39-08]AZF42285.1 PAS domain containing respon